MTIYAMFLTLRMKNAYAFFGGSALPGDMLSGDALLDYVPLIFVSESWECGFGSGSG